MLIKNLVRLYWKSFFVIVCILYLSFAPPSTFKKIPTFDNEDKLVHLLMYAGLSAMLIFDFRNHKKENNICSSFVLACLLFPAFLGGLIEILQPRYFAPRTGSWGDFIADILGVFVGWLFMYGWSKVTKKF
ncbi:MAG: VanZ family protein [Paludibacter sp.]